MKNKTNQSELTDDQVMAIICAHDLKWEKDWKNEGINYLIIASIGHELVVDVSKNQNKDRSIAVLATIEKLLINANQNTINLIGAGLFEAMQNNVLDRFNSDEMDVLDAYLGEKSLKLWKDIIEGWHGSGVRTMQQVFDSLD